MTRFLLALALVALCGCPGETAPTGGDANPTPATAPAIPEAVFLAQRPEGAQPLLAVKQASKVGDEVVFEARVGGRAEPFVSQRAIVTVIDPALPSCAEMELDGCPTPWDYCCETPAGLLQQSGTVRLVGAGGKPLAQGLADQHGLAGLKTVVVAGKVVEANEAGVFVVDASGLWVGP